MQIDKYTSYVKLFTQYFKEGAIEVKWSREQVALSPKVNLETRLNSLNEEYDEKEFLKVAFEILRTARTVAKGEIPEKIGEDELNVISEYFLSEPGIKEFVLIRTESNVGLLKELNYEILTKRNKKTPTEILGYSTLLSINYSNNLGDSDSYSEDRIVLEVTKEEIEILISGLQDALDTFKKINGGIEA